MNTYKVCIKFLLFSDKYAIMKKSEVLEMGIYLNPGNDAFFSTVNYSLNP